MTRQTTHWISGIIAAGLLVFAGCGKSNKAGSEHISLAMALQNFHQAFPSPTTEQQETIAMVSQGFRNRRYPDAAAALTQLSGDASLTDAQKKAVNELLGGVNQMLTNAPPPPPQ
jgi:hypothetical protein